ncbi:toxic anion resistance protein [Stenotrophomonas cyclobalanopsidis]|uniref:toxic anion resistance protein n=1 Tax=Stenotrophomonas cyclobalanopsidis TaxID=2771362 RepID=UPI003460DAED
MSKGELLLQQFSDTNAQIEQLLGDVGVQQALMGKRVGEFDHMHEIVREERHALGLYAAAGKQRLAELQAEQRAGQGSDDPQQRIRQSEVDNAIRLIEKRVSDLQLMQHAADQSLPMIRLIQANALQLIEKFNTVREITIPSWKRQFAIQLSLGEQKAAVELSSASDDASNEMMRRNADLLRRASVDTARSNQRGVIDVATLRHVHDQLIATVEEVRSIHREGMQQRRQAEVELSRLREDLQQRLAAPTAPFRMPRHRLPSLLLSLQAWAAAAAVDPVATVAQASGVQCTDAKVGKGCTAGDVASGDFHDVELTPGCGAQGQRVCVQAIGRAGRNPQYYFVTSMPASSVVACKAGSALCGTYGDRPIQHLKRDRSHACQPASAQCAQGWVSGRALGVFSNGL